jgi:hypothetical protein
MKLKANQLCKNVKDAFGKFVCSKLEHTFPLFLNIGDMVSFKYTLLKKKSTLYRTAVKIVILQHVFFKEHPQDVYEQDSLLWWIPLIYVTPDNLDPSDLHEPVMWMKEERHTNIVNLPGPDYFIIVNPDEIGELSMHVAGFSLL